MTDTGLTIEEIETVTKAVTNAIIININVIDDKEKDELIKIICALASTHISIACGNTELEKFLTAIFSNSNTMGKLLYLHSKINSVLPYGNTDFENRLLNHIYKSVTIHSDVCQLTEYNNNEFYKLFFDAFQGHYANKVKLSMYINMFPIIKTIILISLYVDIQKLLVHVDAFTKSRVTK